MKIIKPAYALKWGQIQKSMPIANLRLGIQESVSFFQMKCITVLLSLLWIFCSLKIIIAQEELLVWGLVTPHLKILRRELQH